jgi:hypothetical protein
MDVNRLTRKVRLDSRHSAIKYQLITELMFLRKQSVTDSDLTYLALLVEWGAMPLKQFCNSAVIALFGAISLQEVEKYSVRVQTVRNRINLLEKRGLVIKQGKGKKMIAFTPSISMETEGNILLEYNFIYIETKESQESSARVGQTAAAL